MLKINVSTPRAITIAPAAPVNRAKAWEKFHTHPKKTFIVTLPNGEAVEVLSLAGVSRSTVVVNIPPLNLISEGRATGCGYHIQSEAVSNALKKMGVALEGEDIAGRGENAYIDIAVSLAKKLHPEFVNLYAI